MERDKVGVRCRYAIKSPEGAQLRRWDLLLLENALRCAGGEASGVEWLALVAADDVHHQHRRGCRSQHDQRTSRAHCCGVRAARTAADDEKQRSSAAPLRPRVLQAETRCARAWPWTDTPQRPKATTQFTE